MNYLCQSIITAKSILGEFLELSLDESVSLIFIPFDDYMGCSFEICSYSDFTSMWSKFEEEKLVGTSFRLGKPHARHS
jgi:hypothetical protein